MADKTAVRNVYEIIGTLLATKAETRDVELQFGWRERSRAVQGTAHSRVILVPGDPSGGIGEWGAPKWPGRRDNGPRPLGNINELFTLYVYGINTDSTECEMAQYEATRLLWDDVYAAVYHAAFGQFQIVSHKWDTTYTERRFGAAMVVTVMVQAQQPDTFDFDAFATLDSIEGTASAPTTEQPYEVTA